MALDGKRVLVVEDEAILAMAVEDMLRDLGCVTVGPALSIAQAQALAHDEPLDAALLDINMGDGDSLAVAETLRSRNVPFCFSTGYGTAGVPARFAGVAVLAKPFTNASLRAVLAQLVG
jgi:CheY-like chemotaxis protein